MSRIAECFARLQSNGKKGLIPYITSGHPTKDITVSVMHAIAKAGADLIELGVPFSDPMADGPVIQKSNEAALRNGVGLLDVLGYVAKFRETDQKTPVVLMGYANPIERMGPELFVNRAVKAGVDGVLVVDYPPEEFGDFAQTLKAAKIDPIFLLAPTSTDSRIEQVAKYASGYVYYVSLNGITGAGNIAVADVFARVQQVKSATSLPVGVGFGIRDGATAKAIAKNADAVVIGSKLIQVIEDGPIEAACERAAAFIASIRHAIDEPV
jgi:tryptophan synthase alpha chain